MEVRQVDTEMLRRFLRNPFPISLNARLVEVPKVPRKPKIPQLGNIPYMIPGSLKFCEVYAVI